MKPTLSFSAAEAPNRLAPAVSITAVVAMRSFLMGFLLTLRGGLALPMRTRPIARFGYLSIRHEHRSQGRGRGRTPGSCARNQNENDDRCQIRQRRHELRGNTEPCALRVQLEDRHRAEQIRADHETGWPPG